MSNAAQTVTYNTNATPYGSAGKAIVEDSLKQANEWVQNNQNYSNPYPEFNAYQGPAQMDYGVNYAENANPYEKVGGIATDWGQFQNQMRQSAYDAYNQNTRDIDTRFAGSGLYGARGYGMHDDTLVKAGQALQQGLLSADATAMDLYGQDLDRRAQQSLDAWKTGITEAERQQGHNANQFAWDYQQAQDAIDFANNETARQDAYNMDQFNWDYNQHRQPFTDYLTLAGGAAPSATQLANSQAQQQLANTQAQSQSDASSTMAWGTAIGSLGGGFLSSLGGDKGLLGYLGL